MCAAIPFAGSGLGQRLGVHQLASESLVRAETDSVDAGAAVQEGRQRACGAEKLDPCAQAAGLGALRFRAGRGSDERSIPSGTASVDEPVSAFGEAGAEDSRGLETATRLRPAADSVGAGGVLPAGRCATRGGAEASGEDGGSVSSGTGDRAEVGSHLQMGERALEPEAGPGAGSEAIGASERLWKRRCVETQKQGFHSDLGSWIAFTNGRTGAGARSRSGRRQRSNRGERTAVEKALRGNPKTGFPLRLEIPQTARDSHFPTATAAVVRLHRKCPDNPPQSYILKWLDTEGRRRVGGHGSPIQDYPDGNYRIERMDYFSSILIDSSFGEWRARL